MSLLLIEDDPNLLISLSLALNKAGFKVESAKDGLTGLDLARSNQYELILLDCNLPRLSGFEIVKRLREDKNFTPIIILTVLGELNNKIELFNLGVDDYLTKPFAFSELIARIKALLRRPLNFRGKVLKVGNLELDPDKFLVTKNNVRIHLPSREFSLLEYLMANKGKFMSRQKIMEEVWDKDIDPFSNTIEVHIMNIRRKLETKDEHYIFTASNRGYKVDLEK
ncbi:response regulator transcription factor [Candidatus Falkowbacteria bacterium]|jgi:DNA-binding response OmpR family regulator|nr:response regulator transcription factor [Candidatus Falkowbacteria bacterium]